MLIKNKPRSEPKIETEVLQEDHLKGPADAPIAEIANDLLGTVIPVRGNQPVETIIFRNQRDPGYPLEFHYSSKTSPFKQYKLIDGHKYTLPVEVIKNLEQCRENIEKYRKNADGIPEIYIAGYKSHFICERAA